MTEMAGETTVPTQVQRNLDHVVCTGSDAMQLPSPSTARLNASRSETPYEIDRFIDAASSTRGTVLYLAYGSNLSVETFRKKRGIKPLAQVNVQVPSLRLTFDLPGIPYLEPCFANSAPPQTSDDRPVEKSGSGGEEKAALLRDGRLGRNEYRKDRWKKGLIGVVYEVTPEDYAHIIATEGGGASYQDILVDCHPFASDDPSVPVPDQPTLTPFKAHTLFSPGYPPGTPPPTDGGREQRDDPGFAQPSARYLKLITDGAAELQLPYEYQDYLHSLRPFRITTWPQRIGSIIFLALWVPVVFSIFGISRLVADKDGRLPAWMRTLLNATFAAVWRSYDNAFKGVFGEGERTIGDGEADDDQDRPGSGWANGLRSLRGPKLTTDLEDLTRVRSIPE